jgi:hypothetical protein
MQWSWFSFYSGTFTRKIDAAYLGALAEISIYQFPFSTQRKAHISSVYPLRDNLTIWADPGCLLLAKTRDCCDREIKEDI